MGAAPPFRVRTGPENYVRRTHAISGRRRSWWSRHEEGSTMTAQTTNPERDAVRDDDDEPLGAFGWG
jgi:hypothetical protein